LTAFVVISKIPTYIYVVSRGGANIFALLQCSGIHIY